MSYVIEYGIPLPPVVRRGSKPFDLFTTTMQKLRVGGSFAAKDVKPRNANSRVHAESKRSGKKFTYRRLAGGGVRVWRIG